MNKQRHKDEVEARIDDNLRDATCKVLVKENECHRWDVRCYNQRSHNGPLNYIGGATSISSFDRAMELAKFYAPCDKAIRVEVGVAM